MYVNVGSLRHLADVSRLHRVVQVLQQAGRDISQAAHHREQLEMVRWADVQLGRSLQCHHADDLPLSHHVDRIVEFLRLVGVGTALLPLIDSLHHQQDGNPLQNLYKRIAVLIVDDAQVLGLTKNYLQKLASETDHRRRMKNSQMCRRKMTIVSFQSRTQKQVESDRLMRLVVNELRLSQADTLTNDVEQLLVDKETVQRDDRDRVPADTRG